VLEEPLSKDRLRRGRGAKKGEVRRMMMSKPRLKKDGAKDSGDTTV